MSIEDNLSEATAKRYILDKFRYKTDFGAFITEVLELEYEPSIWSDKKVVFLYENK